MEKICELLIDYNNTVINYFDSSKDDHDKMAKRIKKTGIEEDFYEYLSKSISEMKGVVLAWENNPNAIVGNRTPIEFFSAMQHFDEILKSYLLAIKLTQSDVPPCVDGHLCSFGNEAVQTLLKIARDEVYTKSLINQYSLNSETVDSNLDLIKDIRIISLKSLGFWGADSCSHELLEFLYELPSEDEYLIDIIAESLEMLGANCIEKILLKLESSDFSSDKDELMYTVLAKLGSKAKSDRIYRCLKNGFSNMKDKVLGALCLKDYGDGKAIPALRGYLEKNVDFLNRLQFHEIKHAIESLGGNVDDLGSRFKNFET